MNEHFLMHGYAVYIWSAYGLALIIVTWNIVSAKIQKRSVRNFLRREL